MGFIDKIKQFLELDKAIAQKQHDLAIFEQQLSDQRTLYTNITQHARQEGENQARQTILNAENEARQIVANAENRLSEINYQINERSGTLNNLNASISQEQNKLAKAQSDTDRQLNKIKRLSAAYKSATYSIEHFFNRDFETFDYHAPEEYEDIDLLQPSVKLKLHSEDLKDLRKLMRENNNAIDKLLKKYEARYTTKTNQALYQLMVLALRAELQNILSSLKYEKLDKAIADIKELTAKYLKITAEGNQLIAGTMTKFIGEIEYLFIEAAKIEYEYYLRKQRIKEEQRALKEQMKQEAEERKLLAKQREQIEKEESKYHTEIETLKAQLADADESKAETINSRIQELTDLLGDVETKKDEILRLQNGQAGHVYVISNIGSFGDSVFKIGMTRRLDPDDRIKELSNASVPFPFDIHSMIFSENAVELEHTLHTVLNAQRVNKVNLRKEFFHIDIDELEKLVQEYDPSAEFTRTALAEQYRQSVTLTESGINSLPEDLLTEDSDDE